MCGIVGGIAERNITPILVEGLKRLEYRGYDSAGMAFIDAKGQLDRIRALGKVAELAKKIDYQTPQAHIGIAHTRWATHGTPSERNAHPHISNNGFAIVHNGIIENFAELKKELLKEGITFESDTDTEVIAHLIDKHYQASQSFHDAILAAVHQLKGAYGLAVISACEPDVLYAVRSGSPLVIGLGLGENFLASDSLSLLPVTSRFIYLEEGDLAAITREQVTIWNQAGQKVDRAIDVQSQQVDVASKGQYKHYMQKEIFEQPEAIRQTLMPFLNNENYESAKLSKQLLAQIKHIRIVACGTSYHAGCVARYWLEGLTGIACDVEIASEIRYRKVVVPANCLFVTVSQSGETADTLAALKQAKTLGYMATLAICNVPHSSLVREADMAFLTHAGIELGVASTKAFTTQLVAFLLFIRALYLARGQMQAAEELIQKLKLLPEIVQQVLNLEPMIKNISARFIERHHALFLGRGEMYPIALEGALKLKEISYIHAEAYAAGELKHGPLALVDSDMPVVAVAPSNELLDKLKANLQEVSARGGEMFVFADQRCCQDFNDLDHCIELPEIDEVLAPVVYTVPLQLLSYHVAVLKGTDVDQPRNLAKSVTVE